jgi:hypothetical protein
LQRIILSLWDFYEILFVLIFYFYLVGLGVYCIREGLHEYKEMKNGSISNVDKNILPEQPNIEQMKADKNAENVPICAPENEEAKPQNIAEERLGLFRFSNPPKKEG